MPVVLSLPHQCIKYYSSLQHAADLFHFLFRSGVSLLLLSIKAFVNLQITFSRSAQLHWFSVRSRVKRPKCFFFRTLNIHFIRFIISQHFDYGSRDLQRRRFSVLKIDENVEKSTIEFDERIEIDVQ